MKALFAAWERRKIRARTKKGIAARARSGKPWGEPGYGYDKRADGHWQENRAEASIARCVHAEVVERGASYNAVAKQLNRDGIPTRRGTRWTATVVRRIATSRHVLGEFEHNGEWHQGQHPPIVELSTWEAAQQIAARNARYAPKGGGGRLPKRNVFVRGSGAARCAGRRCCRARRQTRPTPTSAECTRPTRRRA